MVNLMIGFLFVSLCFSNYLLKRSITEKNLNAGLSQGLIVITLLIIGLLVAIIYI